MTVLTREPHPRLRRQLPLFKDGGHVRLASPQDKRASQAMLFVVTAAWLLLACPSLVVSKPFIITILTTKQSLLRGVRRVASLHGGGNINRNTSKCCKTGNHVPYAFCRLWAGRTARRLVQAITDKLMACRTYLRIRCWVMGGKLTDWYVRTLRNACYQGHATVRDASISSLTTNKPTNPTSAIPTNIPRFPSTYPRPSFLKDFSY